LPYLLRYTKSASKEFADVQRRDVGKVGRIVKCLRKLAEDPRQTGLNSHKYSSKAGPNGEEVWESYVENNTPAAWRVFWCYGPDEVDPNDLTGPLLKVITVIAMTPHP